MFYLSKITLEGLKCFPGPVNIELPPPSSGHSAWTLLLGANGTGKTSILRAIALCLCDETAASGLLTELSGSMLRDGYREAKLGLKLTSDDVSPTTHSIATTIHRNPRGTEELEQTVKLPDDFPYERLFACGYGATRSATGSESEPRYDLLEAVYSLFNYEARLQNPELALRRIAQHATTDIGTLTLQIDEILGLPPRSTELERDGLRVTGPWGHHVPAAALGDGYAATLTWICDLLGWSYLAGGADFDGTVRGIVLVDELEQHLHPSWQRDIINLLALQFPNVQFVATTHSPLVAIGMAALPDPCAQLVALNYNTSLDGVEVRSGLRAPGTQRADQVLTSDLFGLPWTASDLVIQKLERYAQLIEQAETRKLSAADEQTKDDLRRLLISTFRSPEHLLSNVGQENVRADLLQESSVSEAIEQTLRQTADLWKLHFPEDPLQPETRHHLQDLLQQGEDQFNDLR